MNAPPTILLFNPTWVPISRIQQIPSGSTMSSGMRRTRARIRITGRLTRSMTCSSMVRVLTPSPNFFGADLKKQEENGFLGPAAVNGLNAFGVGLIKAVFFWYLAPTMSYSFKHSLNRCPRMVVWSEIVSDTKIWPHC